jgi:hypothetical protein
MYVASPVLRDEFCLYLWRSIDTPGTLYLAKDLRHAQAVYAGLIAEGYLVKAVHSGTNIEYEMCDGKLLPSGSLSSR